MNSHIIDAKHCAECGSRLKSKGFGILLPEVDGMTNLEVRVCSDCVKKAEGRGVKPDGDFFRGVAASMAKDCKDLHELIEKSSAIGFVQYPISDGHAENPFSSAFNSEKAEEAIYASFHVHRQIAGYRSSIKEKNAIFKAFNGREDRCPVCGLKLAIINDGRYTKKIEYGCPDSHLVNFTLDLENAKCLPIPCNSEQPDYWNYHRQAGETGKKPQRESAERMLDRKIAFFADSLLIPEALRKACEFRLCADEAWQHPARFPGFKAGNCMPGIVCSDGKLFSSQHRLERDVKSYDSLIEGAFGEIPKEVKEKAMFFVDKLFGLEEILMGKKKLEVENLLEIYSSYCKARSCKNCQALRSRRFKFRGEWQEAKICGNFKRCAYVSESRDIEDLNVHWSKVQVDGAEACEWNDCLREYYGEAAERNSDLYVNGNYRRSRLYIALEPPCFLFNDMSDASCAEESSDASQCGHFYDKEPFSGFCTVTKQKCLFAEKNARECQIFEKKGHS